jgi:hypothetical protein
VNTHLETFAPEVQVAEAGELLAGPTSTSLPLVLVCVCKSDATGEGPDATTDSCVSPVFSNISACYALSRHRTPRASSSRSTSLICRSALLAGGSGNAARVVRLRSAAA